MLKSNWFPKYVAAFAMTLTLSGAAITYAQAEEGVSIVEANTLLLEAGDSVPVSKIPDGVYLRTTNDPNDIIWERLPEYRVHLSPAPAVHESVELRIDDDDEGAPVYVTLAHTSERLYIRMRWRDDSKDIVTKSDRFRDGAAVQFSMGNDETSFIMGDGPDSAVNIWYWRSDKGEVQNLGAGGPGSTTIIDTQSVSGMGEYVNKDGDPNEWTVVMSRPIKSEDKNEASFERDQIPLAFAVWQGAKSQRDGFKLVSDGWILLDMKSE